MKSIIIKSTLAVILVGSFMLVAFGNKNSRQQGTAITRPLVDTPKLGSVQKGDSIVYVPLFEYYDTAKVIFGTLVNGSMKYINGYAIQKGFKFKDGSVVANPSSRLTMFLDDKKNVFKGKILQAWEVTFDINPLKSDTVNKVKKVGK